MARITRVKHAQQRYAQVTVLDENGAPKRTPVMRKDGAQKTTRHGKPVFMTVKVADKDKPLDMPTCDFCGLPIAVGQPYKHISPKSGPYGGMTRHRHAEHPDWNVWEYSGSLGARLAEISHDFANSLSDIESEDDAQSALDEAANMIRDLAEEKRESAQNIEDGFGHPTSTSEELTDTAEQLDSWASEVESASIPAYPEPEEQDCDACSGTGKEEDEETECDECGGTGQVTPDDPTDEQVEEWRDQVTDELTQVVDESPV